MADARKKIDFIGVGAQKCGTTWLYQQLASHPDICVANGADKDTRFFTCFYDRGYPWYHQQFADFSSVNCVGEVSTSYFYHHDAVSRIKQYHDQIKLFVCLRNPVERILSNHRHEVKTGHINGDDCLLVNALQNNPAYKLQSQYASLLQRWYEQFERDQLQIFFFDDIKESPATMIKTLFEFLGVASDIELESVQKAANVSHIPANKALDTSIKTIGKSLRRAGLGKLVQYGREAGFNHWVKSKNAKSDINNQADMGITDDILQSLSDEYLPEIELLETLTGRDLTSWKILK